MYPAVDVASGMAQLPRAAVETGRSARTLNKGDRTFSRLLNRMSPVGGRPKVRRMTMTSTSQPGNLTVSSFPHIETSITLNQVRLRNRISHRRPDEDRQRLSQPRHRPAIALGLPCSTPQSRGLRTTLNRNLRIEQNAQTREVGQSFLQQLKPLAQNLAARIRDNAGDVTAGARFLPSSLDSLAASACWAQGVDDGLISRPLRSPERRRVTEDLPADRGLARARGPDDHADRPVA
jgi:hypothetical protein